MEPHPSTLKAPSKPPTVPIVEASYISFLGIDVRAKANPIESHRIAYMTRSGDQGNHIVSHHTYLKSHDCVTWWQVIVSLITPEASRLLDM